jgi:hypothetical protein
VGEDLEFFSASVQRVDTWNPWVVVVIDIAFPLSTCLNNNVRQDRPLGLLYTPVPSPVSGMPPDGSFEPYFCSLALIVCMRLIASPPLQTLTPCALVPAVTRRTGLPLSDVLPRSVTGRTLTILRLSGIPSASAARRVSPISSPQRPKPPLLASPIVFQFPATSALPAGPHPRPLLLAADGLLSPPSIGTGSGRPLVCRVIPLGSLLNYTTSFEPLFNVDHAFSWNMEPRGD